MPSLVIIGAQWGDEGKGKLVDFLSSNADIAVRFQGGNNAGHTLVVNGQKTKLSLVPSGILRPEAQCMIGAGVVFDPTVFIDELENLKKVGVDVSPRRVMIDRGAHLVMGYHILTDKARETKLGDAKIGTTGRGIGPAYEDRAGRVGIRLVDLENLEILKKRLERIVEERNLYLKHVLGSDVTTSVDSEWLIIEKARAVLLPYIGNVSLELQRALKRGLRVVFEGAQGTLLDQSFGAPPFVTSSHTISGAATIGAGVGPQQLDYVLGVAKAYSTRVGSGPFPTELTDALGEGLRSRGAEFGTVTGRPRRCGWFDAVALRQAVRLNGFDSVALTKLDVLSGMDQIKICTGYKLNGVELDDVPASAAELKQVEPRFMTMGGWKEDLSKVTSWNDLPAEARLYINTISEVIGCPVSMVSVGPEREQTVFSSGASYVRNFIRED